MKSPDKKKIKKIFKRLTADNLYRPIRFTLRNTNKFYSQFIDKYNWGYIDENKDKSFRFSQEWILMVPYKSYIKFREKPRKDQYRDISLEDHLQARTNSDWFAFYTSNPYSDLCLLCGDIDPIPGYGYEECLEALNYIRKTFHPNTYWEPSTTGRGIHFYIIIDFSTFIPYCGQLYNLFNRQNCNDIIEKYSQLLSSLIKDMFFCKFDKFCGTYPVYSYPISSHIFLSRGDLAKLPCPQSDHEFSVLVNTPILSYTDLRTNWNTMQELLQNTNPSKNPTTPSSTPSNPSYPYNILGGDFDYMCKNDHYMHDNSAFVRTRHSTQKLFRELGRKPLFDEWNAYYEINECNTGEEDEQRRMRYEVVSNFVERTFDPSKIGSLYHYGDFLDGLHHDISQEEINRIVNEQTSYRYKITHQDLDIGLGAHWLAVRTNMEYGKQLSVPRDAIPALFKSLKDKGIIKRSCDIGKSKAIRTVLQQMNYIKLVDPYYSWKKGDHISQRWAMDVKFPKYNDYKLFCGDAEKMAMNIKKMRDEGKGDLVKSSNYLPEVYREMLEIPYKDCSKNKTGNPL